MKIGDLAYLYYHEHDWVMGIIIGETAEKYTVQWFASSHETGATAALANENRKERYEKSLVEMWVKGSAKRGFKYPPDLLPSSPA